MTVNTIIILILIVSAIILGLQFFLSTRKTQWLGLILPALCFIAAAVITVGIVFAPTIFPNREDSNTTTQTESTLDSTDTADADDTNAEEADLENSTQEYQSDTGSEFVYAILILCLLNIPTMVLVAIYFSLRQRSQIGTFKK